MNKECVCSKDGLIQISSDPSISALAFMGINPPLSILGIDKYRLYPREKESPARERIQP